MRAIPLGLVLLALGCGGTEKPANPSASGGHAGSSTGGSAGAQASGGSAGNSTPGGSSSGGSSGSSGLLGIVLGDSPAEACIAYALAVCTRRDECRGQSGATCITATLGCPDLTFSPGATRTVEGLQACAKTYATLPCDQVGSDTLPPCVTPGTRARGEKCTYASQCASLSCSGDSECRLCGVLGRVGDSCAEDDVECVTGTTCNIDTVKCEVTTPVVLPMSGPNEACDLDGFCVQDYYCKPNGTGRGTCAALPKANEACTDSRCYVGNYCAADYVCQAVPGLNEACGRDAFGNLSCGNDTICHVAPDNMSGTCRAPPTAGEPCVVSPANPTGGFCPSPLHCDHSTTPALCKPPGKGGDQCLSVNDCSGVATCECPDRLVSCEVKHCVELRFANQTCTAPSTRCHSAFECTAGVCKPLTLRGDFTQACEP